MSRAADDEDQRALSRVLFGQDVRLGLAIAIARSDGFVNLTDLVEETGFRQSQVHNALQSLLRSGLLVKTGDMGTRKLWLSRVPSLFWDWVLAVAEQPVPQSALTAF